MVYRPLRIPVWLVAAFFATFVVGSSARPAARPDWRPAFRIVTPEVSEVITQDVNPELARDLDMGEPVGVLISDVVNNSLHPGDVILSINGSPVRCQADLDSHLAQIGPGEPFIVEVFRDGRIQTVIVQRALDPVEVLLGSETTNIRGIRVASLSTQDGVIVTEVRIGTPASDAGMKRGDIILEVDGHRVHSAQEFVQFMGQLNNRDANFYLRHTNGQDAVFIIPY